MTIRASIEHFHLLFCRHLLSGPDRADFAIKGGCNLRFFFGSIRYSEDLDLDVQRVPARTLAGRVEKLLASATITSALKSRGISLASTSAPKQTETTQRWKISLRVAGQSTPVNTKVEFFRRRAVKGARVERLDTQFEWEHQQHALLLPHYLVDEAIRQKVEALAGRPEVQARDVFDLSVLFSRSPSPATALAPVAGLLARAARRAVDLSWDEYAGQVVAFLDPGRAGALGEREGWEAIQLEVADVLERAREGR